MIRHCLLPVLSAAVLIQTGCGTVYHLQGHRDANTANPPGFTMKTGEKRLAVTMGWLGRNLSMAMVPPLSSRDPQIVAVSGDSPVVPTSGLTHKVWITALRPGTARLVYNWSASGENQPFLVAVANPPPSGKKYPRQTNPENPDKAKPDNTKADEAKPKPAAAGESKTKPTRKP